MLVRARRAGGVAGRDDEAQRALERAAGARRRPARPGRAPRAGRRHGARSAAAPRRAGSALRAGYRAVRGAGATHAGGAGVRTARGDRSGTRGRSTRRSSGWSARSRCSRRRSRTPTSPRSRRSSGRFLFFAGEHRAALQRIEPALEMAEALWPARDASRGAQHEGDRCSPRGAAARGAGALRDALEVALEHDMPSAALARLLQPRRPAAATSTATRSAQTWSQEGLRLAHRVGNRYWS